MRLPGYDDICDDPNAYVLSAANTNLRDDPWQKSGQVLVRLVADVLGAIEKKLNSRNSSTAQKTRAWFQAQHKTLIALGVSVALEARKLWQPGLAGGVPIELTVQAIGRVVSEMIQEYPADSRTIREWHSAYDRVVYVVGASVTTVLMLAGALGDSTDDDTNREGDDGRSEDEEEIETASVEDAEEVDEAEDSEDEDENGEDEDGAEEDTDDDIEDEDDGSDSHEAESSDDDYGENLEGDVGDEQDEPEEDDPEDEESDEDPDEDDDDDE